MAMERKRHSSDVAEPKHENISSENSECKHAKLEIPDTIPTEAVPSLNPVYLDNGFVSQWATSYQASKTFNHANGAEFSAQPYKHGRIPQFIASDCFLTSLRKELEGVEFLQKSNDLYQFKQTKDLKFANSPYIKQLTEFLCHDFRDWMSDITGLTFTDTVDIFCSKYSYSDVLLCHDDQLEGRSVAFIIYLVTTDWTEDDGGTLDIFNVNDRGHPDSIHSRISPLPNQLLFFEVSPASFHQVSEVLTKCKTRLAISGWLHGKTTPRSTVKSKSQIHVPLHPALSIEESEFYSWINPLYLAPEIQKQIQEKFEDDSEIELTDFLQPDKYAALLEALSDSNLSWNNVGPPNKCCYDTCPKISLPPVVQQCLNLFRSDAMMLVLSCLTGLSLHELLDSLEPDRKLTDKPQSTPSASGDSNTVPVRETETSKDDANLSGGSAEKNKSVSSREVGPAESSNTDRLDANITANVATHTSDTAKSSERREHSSKKPELTDECIVSTTACVTGDKGNPYHSRALDALSASSGRCHAETRRWRHGGYTMLRDTDVEQRTESALDARLFFGCDGWQQNFGGYTSYIVSGEDEELLTVYPRSNALALVYRDTETLHFIKHLNHRCTESSSHQFYDVTATYYE